MEITEHSLALMYFICFIKRHVSPKDTRCLSCEQRLHFRCVSWRAKSSLCRQPFKSVQKAEEINSKTGFFLFLTSLEHCMSLPWVLPNRSEMLQLFYSCQTHAISQQTRRLISLAFHVTNFTHAWYKVERRSAEATFGTTAHTVKM